MTSGPLRLSDEVTTAVNEGTPVVALESTIFSTLGLPQPHNAEALYRCTETIRRAGVTPAVIAVLDGAWHVGLDPEGEKRVLGGDRKVAERDLAVASAQGWPVGVTTVSATVAVAEQAGIRVFSTGGIGGVHRDAHLTGDISADLDALANHAVITVCAGAKAFLDLPRTLEYLEMVGVPVLGWRHDDFPAFYLRSSGLPVPHRVESASEVAQVLECRIRQRTGVLLTVPIPAADELDADEIAASMSTALAAAQAAEISGSAVTPYVLARLEAETDGASVAANLALAEHNAAVAAEVARALAELSSPQSLR